MQPNIKESDVLVAAFSLFGTELGMIVGWKVVVRILEFITEAIVNKHTFFEGSILVGCFLISINLWIFYRYCFLMKNSKSYAQRGI